MILDRPQEEVEPNARKGILREVICKNIVMARHPSGRDSNGKKLYDWYQEECGNHILRVIVKERRE
ncbi:MAG: hypothetical protein ACFFDF_14135 [Candidatus Odinarchaeota archaeon]